MKEILIGVLAGSITALGMGGGTILILLLNMFYNLDNHLIQGINLLFFIPTAIFSCIFNNKNKLIDYKCSKIIIGSGIIGAVIGCLVTFKYNGSVLKKAFGIFLFFIALYEIYSLILQYKKCKKNNTNN